MPGQEKKEKVKQIRKWFEGTDSLFILRYRGLRVADANEFRSKIKGQNAELRVLKNTLTRIALDGTDKETLMTFIDGPIAVVFAGEDPASVARVVREYSRGFKELYIIGGMFEGNVVARDEAEILATLPPRSELLSRAVGQMSAPLHGLLGVCAGTLRKLVTVFQAVARQREEEAPAADEEQPVQASEDFEQKEQPPPSEVDSSGTEEVEEAAAGAAEEKEETGSRQMDETTGVDEAGSTEAEEKEEEQTEEQER